VTRAREAAEQTAETASEASVTADAEPREHAQERSLAFARDDAAEMGTERDSRYLDDRSCPEDWSPETTAELETTLVGRYGEYTIKQAFLGITDYRCELTMKPNAKAKGKQIGWVQVVRRAKLGKPWGTHDKEQGISEDKARRTDAKTGFRVDRHDPEATKTPFFGMAKGDDGKLTAGRHVAVGKHGGADPHMIDTPTLYGEDDLEFISTPTDIATGAQYDAIKWGCVQNCATRIAQHVTPTIVEAGDDDMAGRDRAINLWNSDVANDDIDKVPLHADPAGIAKQLGGMLAAGAETDERAVRDALAKIKDGELRKRVIACYLLETGATLSADLERKLSREALDGLAAWLADG